jgi:L-lysine 2,3-aminomutase
VLPRSTGSYRVYTHNDIDRIAPLQSLSEAERNAMKAVAAVLPFRVNNYVIEDLIDWSDIPNDPIYQLTFPQPAMLDPQDFSMMYALVNGDATRQEIKDAARQVQERLNPHPGMQALNVPQLDGREMKGMQHKYRETLLFFPAPGQTCHAYCTYCFRWAQFVGDKELKFADSDASGLAAYVRAHKELRSVLMTGGDPLVMKTAVLRRYVEPLLEPAFDHLESIRFGTKAPAYWPYRFTTDPDADDLLRLFEQIVKTGRHVALMAHYSHPREIETPEARKAVRRIQSTGAVVRCQAPLVKHVRSRSLLHVRRARHRPQALLRGAARARAADLRGRVPQALRSGPHGARAVDVGGTRQGAGRRAGDCRRRRCLRAEVLAGAEPHLGRPAVLRPLRRSRDLARRSRAGLR